MIIQVSNMQSTLDSTCSFNSFNAAVSVHSPMTCFDFQSKDADGKSCTNILMSFFAATYDHFPTIVIRKIILYLILTAIFAF